MVDCNRKLLVVFIIIINYYVPCFANEKIDSMVGIWVNNKKPDLIFSIDKISDTKYFVCYVDIIDNHTFDFSGVASVYDDKRLFIKVSEDRFFYIYLDYIDDCVLVLWNHDTIYEDTYLYRANYIYDEDLQKQLEEEREKRYWESLINEVKERQKNRELYEE